MGKMILSAPQILLVLLLSIFFFIQGGCTCTDPTIEWFESIRHPNEKIVQFQFYYEPRGSGALVVASVPNVTVTPNLFGLFVIVDYKLTAGPNVTTSEFIGRGQGFFTSSSSSSFSLLTSLNIVLQAGKYKGNSFTIIGYDPTAPDSRELTVIGGSGVFRLARGSALFTSITRDPATNLTDILKATVTILHY